jgi:hypothetical protein
MLLFNNAVHKEKSTLKTRFVKQINSEKNVIVYHLQYIITCNNIHKNLTPEHTFVSKYIRTYFMIKYSRCNIFCNYV